MSDFKAQLAAARAARPFKDVVVVLDGAVSAERERLEKELAAVDVSDDRMGVASPADEIQKQLDELEEQSADSLLTIRLTRLPGRDWSNLTSKCPVRPDVPIDRHYGYNYDAACEAAARYRDTSNVAYGARLEDGEPIDISDDEWGDLFDVLSGSDIGKIRDAVWSLNEYEPEQRLNALVKGSGAASRSVSK
jgi:hypothetical protein